MKITYDDTRDMAIRCIDKMISEGILKEDEHNFDTQDIIQDEINKIFGLDIDDNFEVNTNQQNKSK
jgi:hypothetical protein